MSIKRRKKTLKQAAYLETQFGIEPHIAEMLAEIYDCHPSNWAHRVTAAQLLGDSPPNDKTSRLYTLKILEAVLRSSIRESNTQAALRSLKWPAIVGAAAGAWVGGGMALSSNNGLPPLAGVPLGMVSIGLLVAITVCVISAPFALPRGLRERTLINNRVRTACAEALGKIGEPASIPTLVGALFDWQANVREQAAASLFLIYPSLYSIPYGELPAAIGRSLGRALRCNGDESFRAETLRAIARIGAPELMDDVREFDSPASSEEQRKLVSYVLSVLAQRELEAKNRARLLRPAQGDGEALLRPAKNDPAAPQEQLLRAGTPE